MSPELIVAVLALLIGIPQGIVAVRQLRSTSGRGDARGPARRRVALALAVSSGLFLALGIGTLVGLALAPDPDRTAGQGGDSGSTSMAPTSTAPSGEPPPSQPPATSVTSSAAAAPLVDEISVPPPGCGASAGVDVHLDDPMQVKPGEQEDDGADLEYDDCDGSIYPGTNGSVGLFTGGPAPTREQCAAAARQRPIGDARSIHTMRVGDVLCVVTDETNVVAAVIKKLGSPWGDGPVEGPRQPTITLAITRWPAATSG